MEDFNIKVREIEYKYDADKANVKLSQFDKFAMALNPQDRIEVGSWDIYFAPTKDMGLPFEFMRLRLGSRPQLTIKVKTNANNNNDRIEVDLPIDPTTPQDEIVEIGKAFCGQFGFVENFRIMKYCSIYYYEKTDMVYYIVYDEEMKEKGRFMEVEARKDVKFTGAEEAHEQVKALEAKLSVFGITPQNRTKLSQWERWKR